MPKKRHIPLRSCVACGKKMPKQDLVRLVRSPHGAVTLDPNGKSPGRGAYLCWTPTCWQRGLDKKALDRALGVEFTAQDRERVLAMRQTIQRARRPELGPDTVDGPPAPASTLDV